MFRVSIVESHMCWFAMRARLRNNGRAIARAGYEELLHNVIDADFTGNLARQGSGY